MHIVHIVHIVHSTLCILCIFWMKKSFTGVSLFIATTAWSPIPGPSCSRTTTYNHHHWLLIHRRKLRESQPPFEALRRVLSLQHPPEQEEGVPAWVWRTLESHTKLVSVLVHGVLRWLQVDTDPARLRSINKLEHAKYAKYAENDLIFVGPCTFPAPCISKVGSAYILPICKIWTLHYSVYWFWGLHIILHIDAYICKTICTIC